MIEGKTKSGFVFSIDEDTLNDWETFKMLRKVDRGEPGYLIDAMDRLLGEDQRERMEDHMKEIHGTVRTSDMMATFMEILSSNKAGKNS